ncbi:hypothetical protein CI15_03335 [Paraburkholderia monticola]|uniref:Uncharacterized protein n=1 Tax=Paraburkholderia monticola TaxID=1399968 RepID=A0A149Q0U6_9BURK|nr:hypothetical protein CI15_03335 [Paraburkholderia monticola]
MSGKAFFVGAHEFRFNAPQTAEGAWTVTIVHIDHSKTPALHNRFTSDAVYTVESEALSYAEELAHELARHIE